MKRPSNDPFFSPRLRLFQAIQNLFPRIRTGLSLRSREQSRRMDDVDPGPKLRQLHDFGVTSRRSTSRRFMQSTIHRVSKERRTLRGRFAGAVDFVTPVLRNGVCEGFVISGPFREKAWTAEELRRRWKEISGEEGGDINPDFIRYVTVALDMPVLDEKGMEGYARALELLARWLLGDEDDRMLEEIGDLRRDVFAPRFFHLYWAQWTIGLDKYFSRLPAGHEPAAWEHEEMGVTRPPNVVLALMPRPEGKATGLVEDLCRARAFQWEAFHIARRLGEAVADPLGITARW
jgi:hypothetical protein